MPAKPKRKKPLNLLIKLEPESAGKLIQIAAAESRSSSAQAKVILENHLAEKP